MPGLMDIPTDKVTKLLLMGDSGAGKTGSLASLASEGFNIRMLDLEAGAPILKSVISSEKSIYKKESAQRFSILTLTETFKEANGRLIPTSAKVWPNTVKFLGNWTDGELKLGSILTWGENDVLVIDSLTALGTAAMNYHLSQNGRLGSIPAGNEWRRDIGMAQQMVENLLAMLADGNVKCNVIVISHVTYVDEQNPMQPTMPGESAVRIGFPSSIGKALSPKIPRYFNSVLLARTDIGNKRFIFTKPQGQIPAKSQAPLQVKDKYPLETGLAEYFKAVRSV